MNRSRYESYPSSSTYDVNKGARRERLRTTEPPSQVKSKDDVFALEREISRLKELLKQEQLARKSVEDRMKKEQDIWKNAWDAHQLVLERLSHAEERAEKQIASATAEKILAAKEKVEATCRIEELKNMKVSAKREISEEKLMFRQEHNEFLNCKAEFEGDKKSYQSAKESLQLDKLKWKKDKEIWKKEKEEANKRNTQRRHQLNKAEEIFAHDKLEFSLEQTKLQKEKHEIAEDKRTTAQAKAELEVEIAEHQKRLQDLQNDIEHRESELLEKSKQFEREKEEFQNTVSEREQEKQEHKRRKQELEEFQKSLEDIQSKLNNRSRELEANSIELGADLQCGSQHEFIIEYSDQIVLSTRVHEAVYELERNESGVGLVQPDHETDFVIDVDETRASEEPINKLQINYEVGARNTELASSSDGDIVKIKETLATVKLKKKRNREVTNFKCDECGKFSK
jgi:hypothetical protein